MGFLCILGSGPSRSRKNPPLVANPLSSIRLYLKNIVELLSRKQSSHFSLMYTFFGCPTCSYCFTSFLIMFLGVVFFDVSYCGSYYIVFYPYLVIPLVVFSVTLVAAYPYCFFFPHGCYNKFFFYFLVPFFLF
jgi:hypothetical protein